MGAHRQKPDSSAPPSAAASSPTIQGVVELLSVRECGLVFWSRHHFEVAAELQLRLHREAFSHSAVPQRLTLRDGWVLARGFVVDCNPARRPDGTVGFEITLVFEPVVLGKIKLAIASATQFPRQLRALELN